MSRDAIRWVLECTSISLDGFQGDQKGKRILQLFMELLPDYCSDELMDFFLQAIYKKITIRTEQP